MLLILIPSPAAGQEPVTEADDSTTPSASHKAYLPIIQASPNPCAGETPAVPVLDAPGAGAVLPAEQPVTFVWYPAADCPDNQIHYALQIAIDTSFSQDSLVYGVGYQAYQHNNPDQFYYDLSYHLPYPKAGVYYWRVAAFINQQSSGWSDLRRVTLKPPAINQRLLNPSFEAESGLAPWNWSTSAVTSQVYESFQTAREGWQYLAANRQGQAVGNKSFYQDTGPPEPGKTYHFSIWVRASDAAVGANKPRTGRIDLWAYGGSAEREHSTQNFQVNDTGWRCFETSLKVTRSGHAQLRAEVYLTSLDNLDYYFDHAILRDDGQATCPPPPVNDGSTLITQGQGFDTCAAPSASHLAAWRQASPFEYLGIYLGGANHYAPCKQYNQQYQTPAWFASVSQQGWRFIPIWVGPQAPCTSYSVLLSYDLDVARSQGVSEAQQALAAAYNLGLISPVKQGTIIYYDMEAYSLTAACHNAVNAFLAGWVSELQAHGHKAGIYGSGRVVNDWYTLEHTPDSVWVPWYIRSGYDPGMGVEAVNQQWVDESYWDNHRLFQYSNSHNETWGGATLNIDNDTANGLVALETFDQPVLQEMQFITPRQGWLWLNQQLFWTNTAGEQWLNITPPNTTAIEAVFFLDQSRGWVVTTQSSSAQLYLSQTVNGGQSWQTRPIAILSNSDLPISAVYLDFVDPQTGWLTAKLATGVNFSQGLLFKTEDGGAAWQQLTIPLGEPVRFIQFNNEEIGWTAGGPTNSELYTTRDGGQTWQALSLVSPLPAAVHLTYQLPVFHNDQNGAIAVTLSEAGQSRIEIHTTGDSGLTWQRAGAVTLERTLAPGTNPPIAIADPQHWLIADASLNPAWPANIVSLSLATATDGWAHVRNNTCSQVCLRQDSLFRTGDGGQSWLEIPLP